MTTTTPTMDEMIRVSDTKTQSRLLAFRIAALPPKHQATILATLFEALALAGVDMEMAGCVLEEARHG